MEIGRAGTAWTTGRGFFTAMLTTATVERQREAKGFVCLFTAGTKLDVTQAKQLLSHACLWQAEAAAGSRWAPNLQQKAAHRTGAGTAQLSLLLHTAPQGRLQEKLVIRGRKPHTAECGRTATADFSSFSLQPQTKMLFFLFFPSFGKVFVTQVPSLNYFPIPLHQRPVPAKRKRKHPKQGCSEQQLASSTRNHGLFNTTCF